DWPDAMNDLAWLLATHPDEKFRDPQESLHLAQNAYRISRSREPLSLDTVAAALADQGKFDEAVKTEQAAIDLAKSAGDQKVVEELTRRLSLYNEHRAFRDAPTSQTSPPSP